MVRMEDGSEQDKTMICIRPVVATETDRYSAKIVRVEQQLTK